MGLNQEFLCHLSSLSAETLSNVLPTQQPLIHFPNRNAGSLSQGSGGGGQLTAKKKRIQAIYTLTLEMGFMANIKAKEYEDYIPLCGLSPLGNTEKDKEVQIGKIWEIDWNRYCNWHWYRAP